MSPKRTRKANELPYIPLGPFQWRIPGIHYKLEYVEFFQGLILGATALSSIPYLTDNLGLPYELANRYNMGISPEILHGAYFLNALLHQIFKITADRFFITGF